jgi:tRNA A37 N6-isopentenylltransferase MiaA
MVIRRKRQAKSQMKWIKRKKSKKSKKSEKTIVRKALKKL